MLPRLGGLVLRLNAHVLGNFADEPHPLPFPLQHQRRTIDLHDFSMTRRDTSAGSTYHTRG